MGSHRNECCRGVAEVRDIWIKRARELQRRVEDQEATIRELNRMLAEKQEMVHANDR